MSRICTALHGFWWRPARYRGNGLTEETWVPMLCVDPRIVTALLTELRRAGVPARCTRLSLGWQLPPQRGEWCLWVGYDAYGDAQQRLAEVMPLLVSSLHRGTKAA